MKKQDAGKRPLSPHLQIYKRQLTSVLSASHRITGLIVTLGGVLLVGGLLALAHGPDSFAWVVDFFTSIFGMTLTFLWLFCLYFHLANGIRHLFWDAGRGFALRDVYRSGWIAVMAAALLTVGTFAAALILPGHS